MDVQRMAAGRKSEAEISQTVITADSSNPRFIFRIKEDKPTSDDLEKVRKLNTAMKLLHVSLTFCGVVC